MDVSKVCRCQALFGRRQEGDARAVGASAMRNQSAKALISWRHEVKGSLDCSPRIYS